MATNTVTTEQVREAIEQLAAMVAAASISPQTVANILEMLRNLNDQEREKIIAYTTAFIAELGRRYGDITTEYTAVEQEEFLFTLNSGAIVGKISASGLDFIRILLNGVEVATRNEIPIVPVLDTVIDENPSNDHTPSTNAVKNYVDTHGGGGNSHISDETTQSEDEEFIFGNNARTKEYFKIGSYGAKAKKIFNLDGTPYTVYAENIPDYLLDVITYKPLGKLSKSYLVVIADDGMSQAATYTIPNIVQTLGIPVTFALATNSTIVTNTTYRASLQDAISNYGCGVCQHGFSYWGGDKGARTGTMLTEQELVAFFESEAETWETLGIECLGGACPDHLYDYKTLAVAYHYLKVLCNGASHQVYPNAANGERSNRLELQRIGLHSFSEANIKSAIDYAHEHNGLVIVFSHDDQLQSDYGSCRTKLESIVPYARTKGLEVCSLNKVIKDEFLNAYL